MCRVRRLPVLVQQVLKRDPTALGDTAKSQRTEELRPRTEKADRVVKSICPYCGVGCGQLVYVKDERITNIEGDPDSTISEGCLCPKGAATRQLVVGSHRANQQLYRKPGGRRWASPTSAARRSILYIIRSSSRSTPRSAWCRSRTRRGYDIAPRSPVWGSRSDAAAPRRSSRICSMSTAS